MVLETELAARLSLGAMDEGEMGVVAELRSRHGHSAQPESQQVLAVLTAVLEVIAAEGLQPTPTALFAAVMSALEREDTRSSPQVLAAMLTVLAATLGRVPTSVMRSKLAGAAQLLAQVAAEAKDQAAVAKGAIQCLGAVLSAASPDSWAAAAPAWQLLLGFLTDARPKVRRRAVASCLEVLAAAQGSPQLLAQESDALAQLCRQVLPGPAAAARAAAAASNKQRAAVEEAITRSVADVLHLLGALKQLLPLMAGGPLPGVLDAVLKLYSLRQPLVTRHATDALAALAAAPGGHLSPSQLDQLLGIALDGDDLWEAAEKAGGGADGTLALVRLVEVGLRSLADRDPKAAARRLPRAVHALAAQLGGAQDGVRHGAREALASLLSDPSVVSGGLVADGARAAAARAAGGRGGPPSPLASVVAALVGSLGPAAADSWGLALPVAAAFLRRLGEALQAALTGQLEPADGDDDSDGDGGASGAAAAQAVAQGIALAAAPLVRQVGELYAGAFDAQEDAAGGDPVAALAGAAGADSDGDGEAEGHGGGARGRHARSAAGGGGGGGGDADSGHAAAAEVALGAALRWMGPEPVLAALPLNLKEGIDGTAEPRTWLLPMLRRHVRGARLAYWTASLLPLARALGGRAAAAAAGGDKLVALHCHTLEAQIWAALPAFCSWPADGAAAYPPAAKDWAAAFHGREDLRAPVAAALEKLCRQARAAAIAAGDASLLPPGEEPVGRGRRGGGAAGAGGGGGESDDEGGEASDDGAEAGSGGGDDDDVIDSDDEYGGPRRGGGRRSGASARGAAAAADADAAGAPAWFDGARAAAQLAALRPLARNWLPLLLTTFLASEPEARAPVAGAVAAYASVAEPGLVSSLFRSALSKVVKIQQDAAAELPPPDEVTEGGSTPPERAGAFLEAALALAAEGPLDDAALGALAAAAKPLVLGPDTLLQKKGYKVLASLAERRPGWARRHLPSLLDLALRGAAASASAAKRYRLRLLRPLILLLDPSSGAPVPELPDIAFAPGVPGAAAIAAAKTPDERRAALGGALVGELVLCTKEANTKTREAAYQLLVELAHELDDARPLALVGGGGGGGDGDGMDEGDDGGRLAGGLVDFFGAVLAGLAGSSPHMMSATVMAAARLLFEFSGALQSMAPRLLATVLLLLRSQSREVVKAVLGFVKVAAMRLPAETLTEQLPAILEGLLLWSEDSKNRFRLKTRMIVERLARRCGIEAVTAACPAGDMRLVAHIRKQNARKERRRAGGSEGGSEMGDDDARSRGGRSSAGKSAAARTARASEWGHTAIFGEEGDGDDEGAGGGGASGRGGRGGASVSGRSRGAAGAGGRGAGGRLLDGGAAGEPVDLLEAGTSRQLVRAAAGGGAGAAARHNAGGGPAFETGADGRMVIDDAEAAEREREAKKRAKRKRAAAGEEFFIDSDDSDYDDLRQYAPGIERALRGAKSVRFAPSLAGAASAGARSAGGRSAGGRSAGGRSAGGRSAGGRGGGASSAGGRGQQHSGERFKPKKTGTGGDAKGGGVEPYAYWSFDRKMLNRRRGKQAGAARKLGGLVKGAQDGAAKGAKAKRQAAAKRQKR